MKKLLSKIWNWDPFVFFSRTRKKSSSSRNINSITIRGKVVKIQNDLASLACYNGIDAEHPIYIDAILPPGVRVKVEDFVVVTGKLRQNRFFHLSGDTRYVTTIDADSLEVVT